MIVVVGLSHRTAPLEIRERLAVSREGLKELLQVLVAQPHVGEAMILSTCNRVEVIAASRSPGQATPAGAAPAQEEGATAALQTQRTELEQTARDIYQALETVARVSGGGSVRSHLYCHAGHEGVVHLFRVASSLDSLVVGEPQILGQVKDAFAFAQSVGTIGPVLSRAVPYALRAAKRVRTETALGEGLVSVAGVAVELAEQIFGDLTGRRALLLGAGQMAESAAQLLTRSKAQIEVINRSPERAAELARSMGGKARLWDDLPQALVDVDVVIASTASRTFVLTHALVERATKMRRGRTLFLIDIAVPRDVEPTVTQLNNVFLYDVDDLEHVVCESMKGRAEQATHAEAMVREEVARLAMWAEARGVIPTVVALRTKTRDTLWAEVERTLAGPLKHVALGEAERASLVAMVDAAVNKLLHAPVSQLKRVAADPHGEQMAQVVRELFELPEVALISEKQSADKVYSEKQSSEKPPSQNRSADPSEGVDKLREQAGKRR